MILFLLQLKEWKQIWFICHKSYQVDTKSLQNGLNFFLLMFWIIHRGFILPTPSTIIILHFHRLERWVIYLCSTKVFYRTGKIYAFIISMMVLEYKKSTFFSPLDEQSCFIDYIFFSCVYMNISWRQKAEKKNSILFSPTSSIFYLPHGSQMKIQEKKKTRTEEKFFFFLCSP